MSWSVDFTYKAQEDLEKLDDETGERVLNKIVWLKDNFDQIGPLSLSNEWQGFFKLRIGDWRVIYGINENKKITVYKIGKRDKIYKKKI